MQAFRFGAVFVGALLAAAAVLADDTATIAVDDPYARAVPPGQPNSAVFMALTNTGDGPRALVAAESEAAATVELHTHSMQDGMMRMRRIERIELPAGERVVLEPGGLHVMLIGLAEQLEPGMAVALTLMLDDGSRVPVTAPVRRIDGAMGGGMSGHGGH
jgi:copper(I)-binding protein